MWGVNNEGILPTYSRTADSFDVLAKLFSLLTRLKEGTPTESITDECILLPSQVMIPPLDIVIPAKGLSYILLTSTRASQAWWSCTFNQEPTVDSTDCKDSPIASNALFEGTLNPNQYMDNVRHIYLGKKPFVLRECTRCVSSSLPSANNITSASSLKIGLNKVWDQRWINNCFCGGPWKLTCMEDNSARKNLLASL